MIATTTVFSRSALTACALLVIFNLGLRAETHQLPTLDEAERKIHSRLYTLRENGVTSFQCEFRSEDIDNVLAIYAKVDGPRPVLKYGWTIDTQSGIEASGHWLEGIDDADLTDVFADLKERIPWDLGFFLGFSVGEGPRGWTNNFNKGDNGDTPWNYDLLQIPRLVDGQLVYQFEDDAYLWIDPETEQLIRMKGLLEDIPEDGVLSIEFYYQELGDRYLLETMAIFMEKDIDLNLRIQLAQTEINGIAVPKSSSVEVYNSRDLRWDALTTIQFTNVQLNTPLDSSKFTTGSASLQLEDEDFEDEAIIPLTQPATIPIAWTPLSVTINDGQWREADSIGGQLEDFFDFVLQYGPGVGYFGAVAMNDPISPEELLTEFYPNIDVEYELRRDYLHAGKLDAIVIELEATLPGSPHPLTYVCVFASDDEISFVSYAWAPLFLPEVAAAVKSLVDTLEYNGERLRPGPRQKEKILRPPGLDLEL